MWCDRCPASRKASRGQGCRYRQRSYIAGTGMQKAEQMEPATLLLLSVPLLASCWLSTLLNPSVHHRPHSPAYSGCSSFPHHHVPVSYFQLLLSYGERDMDQPSAGPDIILTHFQSHFWPELSAFPPSTSSLPILHLVPSHPPSYCS